MLLAKIGSLKVVVLLIFRYSSFKVGNESTNYLLQVAGLTGLGSLSNAQFSTYDNDNDGRAPFNCAFKSGTTKGGGFWYTTCGSCYPNGEYKVQGMGYQKYLYWKAFRGFSESLKDTIMLIRRKVVP